MGGLGVAKMFGNFSGALMVLPVLLVTGSWLVILKQEGGFALKYCSKKTPEEEIAKQEAPAHFKALKEQVS